MNKTIKLFLAAVFSLCSMSASADTCAVLSTLFRTISFGTVNVQRDISVGAEIARVRVSGTARVEGQSATGTLYCPGNYSIVYLSGIPSAINGVFNTNLDGVGIKVSNMPGNFTLPPNFIYGLGDYDVSLIKTGAMTSGLLTAGMVAQGWFGSPDQFFTQISLDNTSQINVLGCSVTNQTLNFDLGNVNATQFSTQPGTVSTTTDTKNLGLNCDPATNINIQLTGVQNPDVSAENSVLALTGQGSDGVADGVGVQLLYNNIPLRLNNRIALKQSAGGAESFPIVARYYQTKGVVRPGEASVTATLDLTYQ